MILTKRGSKKGKVININLKVHFLRQISVNHDRHFLKCQTGTREISMTEPFCKK